MDTFPMRGDIRLRVPDGRGDVNGALNQIGERLEEQRRKLKLRQDKLIARIDDVTGGRWRPTRQDLYKIVRGSRSISELELFALAIAVECDPVWLLSGEQTAVERARDIVAVWRINPITATKGGAPLDVSETRSDSVPSEDE